ncbi:MAG: hypothetical protein IJM30_02555 [Thermoguttaceae bacterium]|nr:hypothetical protein [Thermoguttaceae bacterium]
MSKNKKSGEKSAATQLVVALLLAVVAGGLNAYYLKVQKTGEEQKAEYLVYRGSVSEGHTIKNEDLDTVTLKFSKNVDKQDPAAVLERSFYPDTPENRSVVVGSTATRPCLAGVLVARSDCARSMIDAPSTLPLGKFLVLGIDRRNLAIKPGIDKNGKYDKTTNLLLHLTRENEDVVKNVTVYRNEKSGDEEEDVDVAKIDDRLKIFIKIPPSSEFSSDMVKVGDYVGFEVPEAWMDEEERARSLKTMAEYSK